MKKQKGFSLIELLIVVAIILIIAAIAIPNLIRSKMAANEASAVASLRTLNTAQVTYNTTYPNTYGQLTSLGGASPCTTPSSSGACLIDNLLSTGSKSGYNFALANLSSTGYNSSATPAAVNTGTRQFCSNQDLVLYYSATSSGCTIGTNPL